MVLSENKIETIFERVIRRKEIMSGSITDNKNIKFVQISGVNNGISLNVKSARFSIYKFLLFLQDFITINLGFYLAIKFTSFDIYLVNFVNFILFEIFTLLIVGFFPLFKLYNYHNIFYQKRHVRILAKAYGLSIVSLSIIYLAYYYPVNLEGKIAYFIIAFASIAILLISRFIWSHILDITRAFGFSFIAIGIMSFLSPDETPFLISYGTVILLGFFLAVLINISCRIILLKYVFNKSLRRFFRRQIAIIGSDTEAKEIISHVIEQNAPFYIKGVICNQELDDSDGSFPKDRLGKLKDLPEIVESTEINEIIVTDETINQKVLISLLDYCTSEGLTIWFPPRLLPIIDMKLYVDNFCGLPMIRLCSQKNIWLFNKIKHAFDALIGIPIFLVLLPFFILLGIIIKLNSKGPVFYRAKAIGKNGKLFTMYKFRSMRVDSSSDKHKEYVTKMIKGEIDYEGKKDKVFKITDDPRITSVGKFIRKYSIDELPQIINVLKGDMSLIGPRPCLPYEYEAYEDWHKKRLAVSPGISGLWQVAGRSAVTFEDMIILDLYYIYNRSITMDLSIIYETIYTILGKKGAY
jgi:exopolysaccharide biosynthesis polyprenyl glycosylphosphotransferase